LKFSTKVVVGVLWIVMTCFTFGGTFIIDTNFDMFLSEQKNISKNITENIYNLLKSETQGYNSKRLGNISIESKTLIIKEITESININVEGQRLKFSVLESNKNDLCSVNKAYLDKIFVDQLEMNCRAYKVDKIANRYYLKTIRPFTFLGNIYYIVVDKDISHIFKSQKQQYEILIKTTLALSLVSILMAILFSKILLYQVVELNEVTKKMKEGNIRERAKINGNDELAKLAKNFNLMADSLKENMEMLEEEALNRENFVAAFSHEVKTPLTAIIGYADMLRSCPGDEKRIQKGAKYIFSEGKRLERLSKRLLQIMSIKNQKFDFITLEIKEWVESLSDVLNYYLEQKNITLEISMQEDYLKIEPELINMVIVNIIDNAQKASSRDSKIVLNGKIKERYYILKIEDSGIGMDAETLSNIKQPFYKAEASRNRDQDGAGLGLALSQAIMERHNAKMEIYSEMRRGTTVELIFNRGINE
jgi:signal transduction histidine kinase